MGVPLNGSASLRKMRRAMDAPRHSDSRPEWLGLTRTELAEHLVRQGIPGGHALRLFGHLHRRLEAPDACTAMSPRQRERFLETTAPTHCETTEVHPTDDGTEKLVFTLRDARRVEGVIIPEGPRSTFCVSSQVGCAMACAFCATARLGLERALTPGEVLAQIYAARVRCEAVGRPLRNVVFMGMGEPLHHYEVTRRVLDILTDPTGFCLGAPRLTVSTVGLAPRIAQLGRDFEGRIQLAVSLNAGTEATRRALMPITERHGLADLRAAIAAYPYPRNRYVLIEYVLLGGLTDTPAELQALAGFVRGLPAMVNLIPWNPFEGAPADLHPPAPEAIDAAFAALRAMGVPVKVRLPRGRRAVAACGQLARITPTAEVA
jgi:23S rRNA (adenine2503-C2)-methyltransferase